MSDEELDLVETERLCGALKRRFDNVLIVFCVKGNDGTGIRYLTSGGWPSTLGMCRWVEHEILHEPPDEDTEQFGERLGL